jgi:hypothetical protein
MRAWWTYWVLIAAAAVTWVAGGVLARSAGGLEWLLGQPAWAIALIGLPLAAGLNLILYRQSHEEVCRLEVDRHRWLDILTGGGYSARTFLLTGFALVVASLALAIALASGAI